MPPLADMIIMSTDVRPNELHKSQDQQNERLFCLQSNVYVAFNVRSQQKIDALYQYPLNVGC
jgi:hypothetical protein